MSNAAPHTDQQLVERLKKRDNSVYSAIYREHFSMIRYLVVNNSGSEAQANDVFQDGMIALFENAQKPGFQLTASLKTYLYSICRNLWYKRLRSGKQEVAFTDFEQLVDVPGSSEEEDLTERQTAIMNACMEQLGDPCKKLLSLFYYMKRSMDEIAAELGYTNAGNAKNQKYKCLQRLRKLALEQAAQ